MKEVLLTNSTVMLFNTANESEVGAATSHIVWLPLPVIFNS